MPRLIDADDLLMDNSWAFYDENGNRNDACIAVENAPTVDAEPLVRCKNCEHYYADPWGYGNCVFEGGVSRRTKESDFCSWGERKEDERQTD